MRTFGNNRSRVAAITEKLNELREAFIISGASHLWILDADVQVPSHALDSLLRLDVDIASGVYPTHSDKERITGGIMSRKGKMYFGFLSKLKGRVLDGGAEYVGAGNGCLLIKRRVFTEGLLDGEPLKFRYGKFRRSSDLQFFMDAQNMGFEARIHEGVLCGHLPEYPLSMF